VLANRSDAADLVQETFLTASRAGASFEPGAAAKPFLLGVAAQLARRKRRSFARLRAMLEAFAHVPVAPRATPETDLAAGEKKPAPFGPALHAHREVILMVDLGGSRGQGPPAPRNPGGCVAGCTGGPGTRSNGGRGE
jgi:RNA polymerase sigma-70 factor (ECF subfamily)